MYTLLMVLFIILCFFLALFILIQQGKGDLGLGSMGGGQMLFGGSGGQGFFEKATWIMGAIFIFGSLGLAILKSKEHRASALEGYTAPANNKVVNHQPGNPMTQIPAPLTTQAAAGLDTQKTVASQEPVTTPVTPATENQQQNT
jgi:preprotein translocase subunit SecG